MCEILSSINDIERQLLAWTVQLQKYEDIYGNELYQSGLCEKNIHPLQLIRRLQELEEKTKILAKRKAKLEHDKQYIIALVDVCSLKHDFLVEKYQYPKSLSKDAAMLEWKSILSGDSSHYISNGKTAPEPHALLSGNTHLPVAIKNSITLPPPNVIPMSDVVHPGKPSVAQCTTEMLPPTVIPLGTKSAPKSNDQSQLFAANQDRLNSKIFSNITEKEFMSVSDLIRGRVKLEDVNQVYNILFSHFKLNDTKKEPMSILQLSKMGVKVIGATGEAKLKVLRSLKLLTMDRNGIILL